MATEKVGPKFMYTPRPKRIGPSIAKVKPTVVPCRSIDQKVYSQALLARE